MSTLVELVKPSFEQVVQESSDAIRALWPDGSLTTPSVTASLEDYFAGKNKGLRGDVWKPLIAGIVKTSIDPMLARTPSYFDQPKNAQALYRRGIIAGARLTEAMYPGAFNDTADDPMLRTYIYTQGHRDDLYKLGRDARFDNFDSDTGIVLLDEAIGGEHAFATHAGIILVFRSIAGEISDHKEQSGAGH